MVYHEAVPAHRTVLDKVFKTWILEDWLTDSEFQLLSSQFDRQPKGI